MFTLSDETGLTAQNGYVQYQIDWSDIPEGIYTIQFQNAGLTYVTDCIDLRLEHDCSYQLTWKCIEDAWNFNYSDLSFLQSLRISAQLRNPRWKALDKDVFEYSNGDLEITYVSKAREIIFTTERLPAYLLDAISLALNSDEFYIDGEKYLFPDEEVSPTWSNLTKLGFIEIVLRKAQNLRNVNCG